MGCFVKHVGVNNVQRRNCQVVAFATVNNFKIYTGKLYFAAYGIGNCRCIIAAMEISAESCKQALRGCAGSAGNNGFLRAFRAVNVHAFNIACSGRMADDEDIVHGFAERFNIIFPGIKPGLPGSYHGGFNWQQMEAFDYAQPANAYLAF